MIENRTHLVLQELLPDTAEEIINTDYFNCSPPVQKKIDEHVRTLKESLLQDKEQLKEYQKVGTYLSDSAGQMNEDGILRTFYETFEIEKEDAVDFAADSNKLLRFSSRLLHLYRALIEQFLDNGFHTETGEKISLFEGSPFALECDLLYNVEQNIRRHMKELPVFPKERFLTIKASPNDATALEHEVIIEIEKAGKAVRDVLHKTVAILQMADQRRSNETLFRINVLHPLNVGINQQELSVVHGKTVKEGLQYVVRLSFEILKQFHDTQILTMINDEQRIQREVLQKMKTIERIADTETFRQLKMSFLDL
jgi:hypothetical protein